MGPRGAARRARDARSTSCTISRVSRRSSSSPGRCRATSRTTSTRRRYAISTAAASTASSTAEGEPLRVGVEAEPFLVSPNQREAESLVGQEFSDDEDFLMALDAIADLGARNVLITQETSCFGALPRGADAPPLSRVDRAHRARRVGRRRRRAARAASSPRASTAARSTTRFAQRRRLRGGVRARARRPGASTRARRAASPASVELEELQPISRRRG